MLRPLFFALILLASLSVNAGHYEGKAAPTLDAALLNIAEYNQKLAQLLDKQKLSLAELNEVHQLSYTLENALERLDSEIEQIEELLEQVHKASEHADAATVKAAGAQYLERTQPLTAAD